MKVFTEIKKWAEGPFIVLVFLVSSIALLLGLAFFAEDTYSSYWGFQVLSNMGIRVGSWNWTYILLALAPQIGQVLFFYIFLTNTKENKWALFISLIWFAIDFIADVLYRTQGTGFKVWGTSMLVTFGFYTVGSEMFISAGFGTAFATFPNALKEFGKLVDEVSGSNQGRSYKPDPPTSRPNVRSPSPPPSHGKGKNKKGSSTNIPDFPKPKRVRKPR